MIFTKSPTRAVQSALVVLLSISWCAEFSAGSHLDLPSGNTWTQSPLVNNVVLTQTFDVTDLGSVATYRWVSSNGYIHWWKATSTTGWDIFFAKPTALSIADATAVADLATGVITLSETPSVFTPAQMPTTATVSSKYELCLADCAAGDDSTKMCRVSDSEGVATGETAQSSCHLNCMVPMLSEHSDWHMCTRLCNGVPDSATECQELVAADCDASINFLAAEIAQKHCPSLCKTCVTSSTTSTSTSTTTSTTTTSSTSTSTITDTTTNNCRGELDPVEHCFVSAKFCDPLHNTPEIAAFLIATCPVLCNSCVTTSTQTATSVTTTTTKTVTDTSTTTTISTTTTSTPLGECDGVPDNAVCSEDLFSDGSVCTSDVDVIRDEARQLCPALCKLCPTIADCDGKRDPKHVCTPNLVEYCESSIKVIRDRLHSECPAMCNACSTTISSTTATTITTTTTTSATFTSTTKTVPATTAAVPVTKATCNGVLDPTDCNILGDQSVLMCSHPTLGADFKAECLALCNTCIELTTVTSTITTDTVTTTTAICDGKPDPADVCTNNLKELCTSDIFVVRTQLRRVCPVLCNACPDATTTASSTTTSVSSTTTTVSSTTTTFSTTSTTSTIPVTDPPTTCKGEVDPIECSTLAENENVCNDPYFGLTTQKACPVLCNSCPTTTATTATQTTVTTTVKTCFGKIDNPQYCTAKVVIFCDNDNELGREVSTQCPTLCNSCPETSPAPVRVCNGLYDPVDVCSVPEEFCYTPVVAVATQLRSACPALCNSCVNSTTTTTASSTTTTASSTTTSASSTTTTVTTTSATTTTPSCNGEPDPDSCFLLQSLCSAEGKPADAARIQCPVTCNTCSDPSCNGVPDPIGCLAPGFRRKNCENEIQVIRDAAARSCPGLCETCTTSTQTFSTTTATTTTTTSTTATATTATGTGTTKTATSTTRTGSSTTYTGTSITSTTTITATTTTTESTTTETTKTTTTVTTVTTTSRTKTTQPNCNGVLEPAGCQQLTANDCDDVISGLPDYAAQVRASCLILCELCPHSSSTTTTETTVTTLTTTSTATATSTTRQCNGKTDPDICTSTLLSFCATPESFAPFPLASTCPVLCTTCNQPTTEAPTVTTTTASTTTVATDCNGAADPEQCSLLGEHFCTDTFVGSDVTRACPTLCNACADTTTATTKTSTTLLCNGIPDPSTCAKYTPELCDYAKAEGASQELLTTCPVLCNVCTTTSTSVTGTTTTTTATTATATTVTVTTTTVSATTITATTITTTTTFVPTCDGKEDPEDCGRLAEGICEDVFGGAVARFRCPVLCDSCSTTSTTTTTTATTVTVTTVTATITSTTTTTATTKTSTTVLATLCNGLPDPESCRETDAAVCTNPLLGLQARSFCPVLCRTCEETTPPPITTAAPTTKEAFSCNGLLDPASCDSPLFTPEFCEDPLFGSQLKLMCKGMCNTCVPTVTATTVTATTTVITTTIIPACNGKYDPAVCQDHLAKFCASPQDFGLFNVAELCPAMCDTCNAAVTTAQPTEGPEPTLCNGVPDAETCTFVGADSCTDPQVGAGVRANCPLMCGSCMPTTTTFTATCGGQPDPAPLCSGRDSAVCTNPISGASFRAGCPVLCDSCQTTTTATTTTTTASPYCNDELDPVSCVELGADLCDIVAVNQGCPVMCSSCVATTTATITTRTSTSTATTTTTTTTATTATETTATGTTTTSTPTCNGRLDPEVCSGPDIAAFCDLPPEAFGIFSIPVECPLLCNTCKEPTPPPRPECPADDDDLFEQLAIALGGPAGPLSGYSKCADATSWCKAGSGVQPPDSEWSIQSIITLVRDEACQTSCGTC